jgi:hypothetical protein
VIGPLPARLEDSPADHASADVKNFHFPLLVLKCSSLIGLIEPLAF